MGLPALRLTDNAQSTHTHLSCPLCVATGQHSVIGPSIVGSTDVTIVGLPAMRVGDRGISIVCCQSGVWIAYMGSSTVKINGKPAFRATDMSKHCFKDDRGNDGLPGVGIPTQTTVLIGGSPSLA